MSNNVPASERKLYKYSELFKSVWFFLEGAHLRFTAWISLLFVSRFYDLLPPLFISWITDFFTRYHAGESLHSFYSIVAIFGISYALISLIRATAKNKVGDLEAEAVYTVKVQGFERLLDFSLKWHDKENSGNKIQKIINGTQAFRDLRRLMTNDGFSSITSIVGITVIFCFLKPIFVLFIGFYLVFFALLQIYYSRKQQVIVDKTNLALEKASGAYYEGLNNVLTIKTLGAKDSFKGTIYGNEEVARDFKKERFRIGFTKVKVLQVFNAGAISIYLLMVGQGVLDRSISIGTIFVFYSYLLRLIESAWEWTDVIDDLIEIKAGVMRMMPIYKDDQHIRQGNKLFPTDWKHFTIKDASFSHRKGDASDSEDEIFSLDTLNFQVEKHEKVGIVGHSGSGKSTLAKILLGLYDFEKGEFKIEDTNFYDLKHTEITRNIAIVLQDSEMFNLSLKDNITLLKENEPLFQLAVKVSQLEELIERLPNGVDTLIGEKGYRLSGGERQRIGIARAIFKDPQIFVFDEATSSLDSRTESLIQESLETDLKKKTMIIIAHRLSTLKHVDRIYVFEKGKIIEEGRYDELMAEPSSTFYQLYQFQSKQLKS